MLRRRRSAVALFGSRGFWLSRRLAVALFGRRVVLLFFGGLFRTKPNQSEFAPNRQTASAFSQVVGLAPVCEKTHVRWP
jgi:hypothetical protein